jgi:integrase
MQWFQPGTWPTSSLEEIRSKRDAARKLVKEGVNPNTEKLATAVEAQHRVEAIIRDDAARKADEVTIRDMFDDWIKHGVRRGDGNAALQRSFDKDVLPRLGSTPVRSITEAQLRELLLSLVKRGVNRTADVTCSNIQQMFRWAEKRAPWRKLLADGNPADLLEIEKIVSAEYDLYGTRKRILLEEELQELAGTFADMKYAYEMAPAGHKYEVTRPLKKTTQLAIWICLSTMTRIGETLKAEWKHLDFQAATWFIPAKNTKSKTDITIRLSNFALRQMQALKDETGTTPWLFPARDAKSHVDEKSVTKQVGDRQIKFKSRSKSLTRRTEDDSLVLANGKNGEWIPHDMRRTGATMMQQLRIQPDIIDRCQNHYVGGGLVRRAYQQHDYTEEMREAWEILGKRLDRLMQEFALRREGEGKPGIDRSLVPMVQEAEQA